jgi:hypothetical protein
MKKNWPYLIVASLLNALLVTGAFIEFKLRGIAIIEPQSPFAGFSAWSDIDPFQFAAGMFVLSFLVIVIITGIKELVTGIIKKWHSFNENLSATQPAVNQFAIDNGQ